MNVKIFLDRFFFLSLPGPSDYSSITPNNLTVHAGASGLHKAGYFSFSLSFSLFGSTSSSLSDKQRNVLDSYILNIFGCIAEHFISLIPLLVDGTDRMVLISLRRLSVKVSWKQARRLEEKTAITEWNANDFPSIP